MQPENEHDGGQTVADEAADDAQINSEDAAKAPQAPVGSAMAKPKRWRLSRKRTIVLFVICVLAVGGVSAWFWLHRTSPKPAASQQEQASQPAVTDPKTQEVATLPDVSATEQERTMQRFINPTTGETWLPEWKPLPDQKLLRESGPNYNSEGVEYYEVGERAGNKIVLLVDKNVPFEALNLFEQSASGQVSLIRYPDADEALNNQYNNSPQGYIADTVRVDDITHYDSLTAPRTITLQNGHVIRKTQYGGIGSRPYDPEGQTVTEVQRIGGSSVQVLERSDSDTNLTHLHQPLDTKKRVTYCFGCKH